MSLPTSPATLGAKEDEVHLIPSEFDISNLTHDALTLTLTPEEREQAIEQMITALTRIPDFKKNDPDAVYYFNKNNKILEGKIEEFKAFLAAKFSITAYTKDSGEYSRKILRFSFDPENPQFGNNHKVEEELTTLRFGSTPLVSNAAMDRIGTSDEDRQVWKFCIEATTKDGSYGGYSSALYPDVQLALGAFRAHLFTQPASQRVTKLEV